MSTAPPLATERKHLWQSPLAIALVALALRLLAVRLFYHSTWNEYEDHLWFGFETGRIARVGQISHATGSITELTPPAAKRTRDFLRPKH